MDPRGWFGKGSDAPASSETVYYAGVDDLTVREAPEASAKIVGRLELHQKVFRSEVSKGYALVRTGDSSLKGWVVNARLIWKLPADEAESQVPAPAVNKDAVTESTPAAELSGATEPAAATEPVAATEPPAVSEPVPQDDAPEESPPPSDDGSSVFDPY